MKKAKKWADKMLKPTEVEITDGPEIWNKKFLGNRMLIPTPIEIKKLVDAIPKGSICTSDELRRELAHLHHADYTCPLTFGIFLKIVAFASNESFLETGCHSTPYWRVVSTDGCLNDKFPNGLEGQSELLRSEGHSIMQKGRSKNIQVEDWKGLQYFFD